MPVGRLTSPQGQSTTYRSVARVEELYGSRPSTYVVVSRTVSRLVPSSILGMRNISGEIVKRPTTGVCKTPLSEFAGSNPALATGSLTIDRTVLRAQGFENGLLSRNLSVRIGDQSGL